LSEQATYLGGWRRAEFNLPSRCAGEISGVPWG